nr:MAG TPA: hypothetical protein [Caudoviricetes sp.]
MITEPSAFAICTTYFQIANGHFIQNVLWLR